MSAPVWSDMVTVGRIIRPHGHRGQVVVAPETDFGAERFRAGAAVFIQRAGQIDEMRVTASREFDGRWIVGFDRVTSMNEAETLRGHEVRIADSDLHPLAEGQFYLHDLVGCRVETIGGDDVGVVEHVHVGPGQPVLEVRGARGEVLVPFVDAICRRVDVPARTIVIDPPEGLIADGR
jgi:16S rRNA processing protein RimM